MKNKYLLSNLSIFHAYDQKTGVENTINLLKQNESSPPDQKTTFGNYLRHAFPKFSASIFSELWWWNHQLINIFLSNYRKKVAFLHVIIFSKSSFPKLSESVRLVLQFQKAVSPFNFLIRVNFTLFEDDIWQGPKSDLIFEIQDPKTLFRLFVSYPPIWNSKLVVRASAQRRGWDIFWSAN